MIATWTMRCASMLRRELQTLDVEQISIDVDGGEGQAAMAAIMATQPGPRRDFEIALWARRLSEHSCGRLAVVIRPDMSDEELDAYTSLLVEIDRIGRGAA